MEPRRPATPFARAASCGEARKGRPTIVAAGAHLRLVIPPATTVPGRARRAVPLRRDGPEKLTGVALYTDDIVVPGAWFGATIGLILSLRMMLRHCPSAWTWLSTVLMSASLAPRGAINW